MTTHRPGDANARAIWRFTRNDALANIAVMVATDMIAAVSVQHAQKRFRGFGETMRRAPYVSCGLLVILATYMAWHGWTTLPAR